jgi:hypothetical protein
MLVYSAKRAQGYLQMNLHSGLCGTAMFALVFLANARADEKPEPAKPSAHTARKIEGWSVRVDDRLLQPPNQELGERAIKALAAKLADINVVVGPAKLEKLHAVKIQLDLSNGGLKAMQYHPDVGWLVENGYDRKIVHCVHIPVAAELLEPEIVNVQPWCVLHELAHAYHDQILGFDEPRIREAYEKYKKGGHGDSVLFVAGGHVRHYALTDHKEFFAEMSESYFGSNDFFPFNRAELMTAEPEIYHLLLDIWGPVETNGSKATRQSHRPATGRNND